jgi:hypothetical protein
MRTPSVLVLLLTLSLVPACSDPGKAKCSKMNECCTKTSTCSTTGATGYLDRCTIAANEQVDLLGTYGRSECDAIATAVDNLNACLGGITCDDIETSSTHVAKCDAMAVALCNAKKASGDACGGNYGSTSCDGSTAHLH